MVTCAVAFFAVVAPFAAYANHLKGKGEDVCDRMPEWTREYVPRSLRPAESRVRFSGSAGADVSVERVKDARESLKKAVRFSRILCPRP